MKTTSFRISGFPPSPSLYSPKLDRHLRISFLLYTIFACSFGFSSTKAALNRNLEFIDIPKSVTVQEAHELLLAGHGYLGVRTPEEFKAGHPPGLINIQCMYKVGVVEVVEGLSRLVTAGFSAITNVAGGFDAWVTKWTPNRTVKCQGGGLQELNCPK